MEFSVRVVGRLYNATLVVTFGSQFPSQFQVKSVPVKESVFETRRVE
jgi:hypothetical protein